MLTLSKNFASAALLTSSTALFAQQVAVPPVESAVPSPPYAMYAELVIGAPIVADATIRSASRLKPAEAPDLAPGFARFYVEADVSSLIRSPAPLPPRIGYLYNAPLDAQGRAPRIGKARVLLFARTAAQPGQIQLVRPDAQQGWTPGGDALARRIVQEVLAADAPPAISGVGKAFHVPGALPGEGETQIFLNTAGGRPVSLSVARAADGQRSWSVSLSEIVDAAAAPPPRDTLLWYRLACGLPATLPEASVAAIEPGDAAIARDDYAFVLGALGPCHRGGTS